MGHGLGVTEVDQRRVISAGTMSGARNFKCFRACRLSGSGGSDPDPGQEGAGHLGRCEMLWEAREMEMELEVGSWHELASCDSDARTWLRGRGHS